jgi:ferritin
MIERYKNFRTENKTIEVKKINEAAEVIIEVGEKAKKPNTLPDAVVKMINERIGDEYTAHYFYRNAANWCKNVNYKKAAAFFEGEAAAELEHAKGLQDYLDQWNIMPEIPAAPTKKEFTSLVEVVNGAYDLEYDLFEKYSADQKELFDVHPATFNFIQGYVNIQNESVAEFSDLLNAVKLVDENNKLDILYFENNYFG